MDFVLQKLNTYLVDIFMLDFNKDLFWTNVIIVYIISLVDKARTSVDFGRFID